MAYLDVAGSAATSISTPLSTDAGTVFNFSSPGATGDWYAGSTVATADASASTTKDSPGSQQSTAFGAGAITPKTLYIVGAITALVIIGAMFAFKKHVL
jgi:hypothetical protein